MRRYKAHVETAVNIIKDGVDWHVKYKHLNKPEIVANLFAYGPIERGVDMSNGGVDIYNFACDATALATVADSLAVIEKFVVEEKKLTWEELQTILKNNWEGAEHIRLMFKSIPKYGSGNSRADYYAKLIADMYTDLMIGTPTRLVSVCSRVFSPMETFSSTERICLLHPMEGTPGIQSPTVLIRIRVFSRAVVLLLQPKPMRLRGFSLVTATPHPYR